MSQEQRVVSDENLFLVGGVAVYANSIDEAESLCSTYSVIDGDCFAVDMSTDMNIYFANPSSKALVSMSVPRPDESDWDNSVNGIYFCEIHSPCGLHSALISREGVVVATNLADANSKYFSACGHTQLMKLLRSVVARFDTAEKIDVDSFWEAYSL